MKISMASLALAMLAEIAIARTCNEGLSYCGFTLNSIGTVKETTLSDGTDLLTRF
jgi:hypothetical protein